MIHALLIVAVCLTSQIRIGQDRNKSRDRGRAKIKIDHSKKTGPTKEKAQSKEIVIASYADEFTGQFSIAIEPQVEKTPDGEFAWTVAFVFDEASIDPNLVLSAVSKRREWIAATDAAIVIAGERCKSSTVESLTSPRGFYGFSTAFESPKRIAAGSTIKIRVNHLDGILTTKQCEAIAKIHQEAKEETARRKELLAKGEKKFKSQATSDKPEPLWKSVPDVDTRGAGRAVDHGG